MNKLLKLANKKDVSIRIKNQQTKWIIDIWRNNNADVARFDSLELDDSINRAITYLMKIK